MSELPTPTLRRPRLLDRAAAVFGCIVITGCVLVVWQRDAVRAAWWAHRLARTESLSEQTYYFTMLAALRDAAVPAARSLLHNDRTAARICGAALLARASGESACRSLIAALADPDEGVRDAAAHGLAFGHADAALPELSAAVWTAAEPAALAMCVAIGRMPPGGADTALVELACRHSDANVRAQAAELIGIRRLDDGRCALRGLTEDRALVSVELYAEHSARQAAAAARPTSSSSAPATHSVRRVADVARVALEALDAKSATLPNLPDGISP